MDELKKYTSNGKFQFKTTDRISQVCNAPNKHGGIYIVFANKSSFSELVYIGISGRIDKQSGKLIERKGGIKDRIVNGKRDGESRKKFWIGEMIKDEVEFLEIFWYVVHDQQSFNDSPIILEKKLIAKYKPRWNRK